MANVIRIQKIRARTDGRWGASLSCEKIRNGSGSCGGSGRKKKPIGAARPRLGFPASGSRIIPRPRESTMPPTSRQAPLLRLRRHRSWAGDGAARLRGTVPRQPLSISTQLQPLLIEATVSGAWANSPDIPSVRWISVAHSTRPPSGLPRCRMGSARSTR